MYGISFNNKSDKDRGAWELFRDPYGSKYVGKGIFCLTGKKLFEFDKLGFDYSYVDAIGMSADEIYNHFQPQI